MCHKSVPLVRILSFVLCVQVVLRNMGYEALDFYEVDTLLSDEEKYFSIVCYLFDVCSSGGVVKLLKPYLQTFSQISKVEMLLSCF